jgi:ribosomal protein S27AE
MPDTQPLICPSCGVAMNRHAEKLILTPDAEAPDTDPALGGVLEEAHTCPRCGKGATRRQR